MLDIDQVLKQRYSNKVLSVMDFFNEQICFVFKKNALERKLKYNERNYFIEPVLIIVFNVTILSSYDVDTAYFEEEQWLKGVEIYASWIFKV